MKFLETLNIRAPLLQSRQLRKAATGGLIGGIVPNPVGNGVRTVNVDDVESGPNQGLGAGPNALQRAVKRFLDPLKRFAGFVWPTLSRMLPRNFSELWTTVVQVGMVIWTFDWNQTDQALRNKIKQNNQQILNAAAGALGTYLGYGAIRIATMLVPGLAKMNQGRDRSLDIKLPVITGRAAAVLAEEANEEVRGQLQALLMQIKQAQISNTVLSTMLFAREHSLFGLDKIAEHKATDSFAKDWENAKEKLPKWLQQPVENLTENFVEAIIDGGFIFASEFDSQYALARSAARDARGPIRTVTLQPDPRLERDKYVVTGPQQFVMEEVERIKHDRQTLGRRDVGIIVGEPLEDALKKAPLSRQLKIRWATVKEPPLLESSGTVAKISEINIPRVRMGISWNEIKAAADEFKCGNGKDDNYRVKYLCYDGDDYLGNLVVRGYSEQECERRARKLKTLMPAGTEFRKPTPMKITPSSNMEKNGGIRIYYPLDCSLTVHRNSKEDLEQFAKKGKRHVAKPDEKYFEDRMHVELWPKTQPDWFAGFR